ncbi:MAG: hypothetical protein R2854_23750 [Caldilineaceae bacterium]
MDKPFPAFTPSLLLDDGVSLVDLGVNLGADAHVLPTPGHTPGSVSLILPDQGDAIVGDVLMGDGWAGRSVPPGPTCTTSSMMSRSRPVWIDRWR